MHELAVQERLRKLRRKLSWRKTVALCALLLVAIGVVFGFADQAAEAVAPKPDYHRLLFDELARQHFAATGTPTIVKEDDYALEFFEREHDKRLSTAPHLPTMLMMPLGYVWQFSYDAEGIDLTRASFEEVKRHGDHFPIRVPTPLALWVYSNREQMLVCIAYQLITPNHPLAGSSSTPQGKPIESLDLKEAVTVQGSVPTSKVLPAHAFLIPFRDLKLSNLDRHSTEDPNLALFDFALPIVIGSTQGATIQPPQASSAETIARLRQQAGQPFFITRRVFRLLVVPLGLLLFLSSAWFIQRLHKQFEHTLTELAPASENRQRHSFLAFAFGDWDEETSAAMAQARNIQQQLLANERKRAEINELTEQLRHYAKHLPLSSEEAAKIDQAMSHTSEGGLRQIVSVLSEKAAQNEHEQQVARDRQREIQWLASEFEAIPKEKRDQAREAWELYQHAVQAVDLKAKLHLLKEARKKLPRDLKPERV